MLRKISFFLIGLLSLNTCFAQVGDTVSCPGKWSIDVKLQYGFIMTHRPTIIHLQKKHTKGLEINYLKPVDGNVPWMQDYNLPLIGVGFQAFDLGNKEEIGNAYTLYPMILFPLFHKHHLHALIKFGLGMGYVDKPFDVETNYKNLAIGSKLNVAITTGLQFRFFESKKLQLLTGIELTHLSNGASNIPNAGINVVTANIGASYFFREKTTTVRKTKNPLIKKWETSSYIGFGFKEIYPLSNKKYTVIFNTTDFLYRTTRKSLFGGGIDLAFDQSIKRQLEIDSIYLTNAQAGTRIGIHGSYALRVGRVTGVFQTGVYLYNKLDKDGSVFNRLSLRYFVNDNVFVCFNLKSHYAKADYFEWGVGYRF